MADKKKLIDILREKNAGQKVFGYTKEQVPNVDLAQTAMDVNQFLPYTGDVQAGVMAANDLKNKKYASALLNSVGLLPFVPAMGGILKNPALQQTAKEHFGTTFWPQETGYIMDDLSRLDLTGRHQATGYKNVAGRYIPEAGKPDYLKMERSVDHREVAPLLPEGTESGWGTLSKFLDDTGAIRYDSDYGISLVNTNKPNTAQVEKVVNDFRKSKTPLNIDLDHYDNGRNLSSKEFENPTVSEVQKWIDNQYKLHGNK